MPTDEVSPNPINCVTYIPIKVAISFDGPIPHDLIPTVQAKNEILPVDQFGLAVLGLADLPKTLSVYIDRREGTPMTAKNNTLDQPAYTLEVWKTGENTAHHYHLSLNAGLDEHSREIIAAYSSTLGLEESAYFQNSILDAHVACEVDQGQHLNFKQDGEPIILVYAEDIRLSDALTNYGTNLDELMDGQWHEANQERVRINVKKAPFHIEIVLADGECDLKKGKKWVHKKIQVVAGIQLASLSLASIDEAVKELIDRNMATDANLRTIVNPYIRAEWI